MLRQNIIGWLALLLSTSITAFWGFWGVAENFHEGWWQPSLLTRLLMTVAYLGPMLICLGMACCGLALPRVGGWMYFILGGAFTAFIYVTKWRQMTLGAALGWLPLTIFLIGLGLLWWHGRPQPRRLAWALLLLPPLFTVIACSIEPIQRVTQRHDDGVRTARLVEGNGVALVWAPAGPGWVRDAQHACDWHEATSIADHLGADGLTVMAEPQHIWRLPTVDEAARCMSRGGVNAGGSWDGKSEWPQFRIKPDKESPLWEVYAETIYWWTATEPAPGEAYKIVYDGRIYAMPKDGRMGTLGFRAVREPEQGE